MQDQYFSESAPNRRQTVFVMRINAAIRLFTYRCRTQLQRCRLGQGIWRAVGRGRSDFLRTGRPHRRSALISFFPWNHRGWRAMWDHWNCRRTAPKLRWVRRSASLSSQVPGDGQPAL